MTAAVPEALANSAPHGGQNHSRGLPPGTLRDRIRSVISLEQQITTDPKANKSFPQKKLRLAAAVLALVLLAAAGGGFFYHRHYAVASTISLDVNPGIELTINRNEQVLSCTALDEEAAAVLFRMDGGKDLKGTKLDVAVSAIVGALVQEGYMDGTSSILISVEDGDPDRAARLQQELVASVDGVLQSQASGAAILSQTLTQETAPSTENARPGISAGKASLVRQVMERGGADGSDGLFDALAALSVDELDDLLEAGSAQIPIGKGAARQAAEEYAGTLALDSVTADVDSELDESPARYEVELKTAWGEFEYIVDAWSGQVLSGQKDLLSTAQRAANASADGQTPGNTTPAQGGAQTPDSPTNDPAQTQAPAQTPESMSPSNTASSQDIGADVAKQAALDHAGLAEADVTGLKIEQDWDDGRLEYDIDFWCGGTEYDYTIDAASGAVLKHEWEHHSPAAQNNPSSTPGDIGPDAAKAAALSHAGVEESQTRKMKVEPDWDDGRLEYDVEFEVGHMEYEYTVDGATGAILEYEQDWD